MEADADRHEQIDQPRILMHADQRRNGTTREVCVFERSEKCKVGRNPQRKQQSGVALPDLARMFQRNRNQKIARGEDPQEQDVPGIPARVEVVAREQQDDPAGAPQEAIKERRDDREEEPKLVGLKAQRDPNPDRGSHPEPLGHEAIPPVPKPAVRFRRS
jgi:hypothetical protein